MTIKLPVVGGPRHGEVREFDHLGTTWSRSDVYDGDKLIGFYHCDGPGAKEITFISIEEYRSWVRGVEHFIGQHPIPEINEHIENLLKEQGRSTD